MQEVENKVKKINNSRTMDSSKKDLTKKDKKGNNAFFGLSAVFVAIIIIVLILGAVFYLMIHNNVNGIGDKYRNQIKSIPLLRLALAKPKESTGIEDLSIDELKQKYKELDKLKDNLSSELETANNKINELLKHKENEELLLSENENLKKELEEQIIKINKEKNQLDAERIKLSESAAQGDIKGFKEFYETLNNESASAIYKDIMQQEKVDIETKKMLSIYENMEATSSAKIFEQMKTTKFDLVIEIIKNMKNDKAAEVLAEMDPKLASEITEKLVATFAE